MSGVEPAMASSNPSISGSSSQDPDEEPLPAALQQLLAELGGSSSHTQPLRTDLLDDLSDAKYGHFFKWSWGLGALTVAEEKRRWEVRLQVLNAIANGRTLKTIRLSWKYEIGEDDGGAGEVEALFGGLASTSSNSALEKLDLSVCEGLGSETSCTALGGLLRRSRTLQDLSLFHVEMHEPGLGHVVGALQANPHSALRVLDISENFVGGGDGGAVHVATLLDHTVCPSLRDLKMCNIGLDMEGAEMIGQALARNTTLQGLQVGGRMYRHDPEAVGMLLRIGLGESRSSGTDVVTVGNRSVIRLEIYNMPHECVADVDLVFRTNVMVEECDLKESDCASATAGLELDRALGLKKLSMSGNYSELLNATVFTSLGENKSLQTLSIRGYRDLDMEIFTNLIQSLSTNISLETIEIADTTWEKEGKCALVKGALLRNRRQDAYLPIFYRRHFEFVVPKVGRLFLCGPPKAGKSTIRRNMVHFQQKFQMYSKLPMWMMNVLPWKVTEGIEIEHISNDDEDLQVSIWDLAGQAEFRILHDYLFPNIHQACLFLFVFSPFDHELGDIMSNEDICAKFEDELKYWLTFIASNVKKEGVMKPQLLVVITHLDKFQASKEYVRTILHIKVSNLKDRFVDLVDVFVEIKIIDACSMKYMKNVLTEVFHSLKLLCEESKNVPEICEKLSSGLINWVSKNPSQPFMRQKEFESFCVQELGELSKFEVADRENIVAAILSYLHDTGRIIYFKKNNLIVVNPNWITHIFLGNLIQSYRPLLPPTSQGFVERELLEQTLTNFTKNNIGVETQDLVNIMLELELCYEAPLEDMKTQGFFIPTTIHHQAGSSSERLLQWPTEYRKDENYEFLGRRLQCEDLRTFLTEGFFPRFQVVLRNRLFSKADLGMHSHQYIFGYNLISIVYNGMDILIECSGGGVIGDYVDILIRSKQRPGFARIFMRQHIFEELRDFCASPNGCPGVSLVEGIINPYCVSHLIPCRLRRNQAYLETDLTNFLLDEEQALECGQGYFVTRNISDFVHSWPVIGDDQVNGIRVSHRVEEFVDAEYLADIVQRNIEFYEQRKYCIEEVATDLVFVSETITSSKSESCSVMSATVPLQCPSYIPDGTESGATWLDSLIIISRKLDMQHLQVMGKLDHNHKEVVEMIRLVEVKVIESKKETIRVLKHYMDDIIGYDGSTMPRRPYFCSDGVSFQEKFMALIQVGKAVHLHLMCEQSSGYHIVPGQLGYPIVVQYNNYKWIRKFSVMGTNLLWFLSKAGLHVAAGLGDIIPDFAMPVTGAGLVGETFLDNRLLPDDMVAMHEEDVNIDAWLGLKEVLESLHYRMWELFQLTQVRYAEGKETAWLCTKCMKKCKAAGLLMQR